MLVFLLLFFIKVGVLDKKRILQRNLNNIAKNADTSTAYGLNCTLKGDTFGHCFFYVLLAYYH